MGHGWGEVNEDSSTQVDKPNPISKRAQSERVFTAYHWALKINICIVYLYWAIQIQSETKGENKRRNQTHSISKWQSDSHLVSHYHHQLLLQQPCPWLLSTPPPLLVSSPPLPPPLELGSLSLPLSNASDPLLSSLTSFSTRSALSLSLPYALSVFVFICL